METVRRLVSYADLQRMPDDGNRYELYDGELCVVPSPLPGHQVVAQRLFLALHDATKHTGGAVFHAPFDIVLSEYNVVQPDVIYFGPESASLIHPGEHVRFPPDAAFEVLSPSTARNDRGRKRQLLARFRVAEYWIIDPRDRVIELSQLTDATYREPLIVSEGCCASSVVPGFAIDLAELFADGLQI